jgi:DMSO reductase anchor subunit
LAIANLHLGRPQIAYRAWLGWRTSWMSREIIAFGAWSLIAGGFVAATMLSAEPALRLMLWGLTALTGVVAVFCSAMIYVATRRAFWSAGRTVPRFLITTLLLGSAGSIALAALGGQSPPQWLVGMLLASTVARLIWDAPTYRLHGNEMTELDRSARLLTRNLSGWNHLQAMLAIMAGVLLPLCWFGLPQFAPPLSLPAALLLVGAEIIQRGLFFAAVSPSRMPGVTPS